MQVWEFEEGKRYLVRVDRGEDVMEAVRTVAADKGIEAGRVTGIGALADAELGYFDVETKEYSRGRLPGSWELLSLVGNISLRDGRVQPHLHVLLGNAKLECRGGHLFSGTVSVTGEIFIDRLPGTLRREVDPEVRLPLLAR